MRKVIFGTIGLILAMGVAAFWLLPETEMTESSTAEHQFVVEVPMQRVRKILVRTNAVKKIVAMANAELESQEWLDMDFDAKRPILDQDWKVDGQGELKIVIHDAYLGEVPLTLTQDVAVEKNRLNVTCVSTSNSGPIQEYRSSMVLTPDANGDAQFQTSLALQIKTTANLLNRQIVSSSIRNSAMKALEQQEQAIREVVSAQDGKLIILPDGVGE